MDTLKADRVVQVALDGVNQKLSDSLKAEVIALKAPMRSPVDDIVRDEVDSLTTSSKSRKNVYKDKLVVMLETTGGFIEVVERIALAFRKHYSIVEFIIPNFAYSAGTILALSGDELYMDYYSILGPIDPQFPDGDGDYFAGMGYLAKFNELLDKVNRDKMGDNTRGELAILLRKFHPTRIFDIEQAVKHSKDLLQDWLPKYKFKNWTIKETSQVPVTDADRRARAGDVAEALGDAEHWHSHGRGITIRDLEGDKIKLKVKDFGADAELNRDIRHYHGLLVDFMQKMAMKQAFHSRRGLRRIA